MSSANSVVRRARYVEGKSGEDVFGAVGGGLVGCAGVGFTFAAAVEDGLGIAALGGLEVWGGFLDRVWVGGGG